MTPKRKRKKTGPAAVRTGLFRFASPFPAARQGVAAGDAVPKGTPAGDSGGIVPGTAIGLSPSAGLGDTAGALLAQPVRAKAPHAPNNRINAIVLIFFIDVSSNVGHLGITVQFRVFIRVIPFEAKNYSAPVGSRTIFIPFFSNNIRRFPFPVPGGQTAAPRCATSCAWPSAPPARSPRPPARSSPCPAESALPAGRPSPGAGA
jgi:hypothetical protein